MTVYSLLEEVAPPKRHHTRRWQIGFLILGSLAIVAGVILVRRNQQQDDTLLDKTDDHNITVPVRSINFTIPNQDKLYYVDLDKYPVEDNMIKLFATSQATLQSLIIDKLSHKKQNGNWTDDWLAQPNSNTNYSCDSQLLPYPILRKIVAEYTPLTNSDALYDVETNIDFSKPFVVLPFSKQPNLIQGQKVCVRVVVPYQNIAGNDTYHLLYRPYDHNNQRLTSPWWDTMMTTLENIDTNATLPITLQPWSGHALLRNNARELNHVNNQIPEWSRLREDEIYEREKMHVYEATVTLPPNGTYQLQSLLEFVEGRYNFEFGPVSPYKPVNLPVYPSDSKQIIIGSQDKESIEQKQLKEHLALPLCKGADNAGRWLPWPRINSTDSDYASKEDLHLIAGLTRNGKYWAPYQCRYRHISYEQFNRCAANKYSRGIDLYGDSNIRRSVKKFVSHGQWCKNWEHHIDTPLLPEDQAPIVNQSLIKRQQVGYGRPEDYRYINPSQTRSCYCEDYSEEFWKPEWFNGNARRFDLQYTNSIQQSLALGLTEWDQKGTGNITYLRTHDVVPISSYKWDGLTYLNNPAWDTAVPTSTKPVDIAIFSLGNWDAAFARLEPFLNDVDHLIRQIREHYDLSKTRIIYRTAQYYCCRIDTSGRTRQVSGPRLDVFDKEVQLRFKRELKAEIWDTYTLGESKPWDEKITSITCPSNHVPADQVEIENQVLMNGLCNL
ncbi:hypothetical protein INT47_005086 [Mucor saturninus]|uniref:Uncharacterized protein n=1 Tax=Mucor saturninus TaxID=64648 RepID=A0A8H7QUQ5_9FUNG|nr:hypothetical protein INT47_005086 [Mucor saturninus]